ncbi:XrtA/PEP-CTERM system histidine kinase PrsK [Candidatus Colwellia aromaticivorans]|uniref:XrtA/PEP-CTERM system histidine kinase PrsK n=1 Tax=Candidatus Colwellia aromaticivorans TaxID=2267621 RepID=UPI000DF29F3D|nr:XrtA/PEP-CTERM system histidine kinase PrsK [Candidatus Colwellia aromaticivorans]
MALAGISGYLLATCAYLVFILLLFAARNNTLSGKLVLIGSVLILASSVTAALQIDQAFSLQWVLLIETFKLAIWSLLILSTQANVSSIKAALGQPQIKKYLLTWLFLSLICWAGALFQPEGNKYLFSLFLLLNLWLMVLLEQLYRNADVKVKWALWSLIIALGTSTVFDFVLFAQAVMVNQLDFSYWYARGFVTAIGMPLILVSTRRIKNWSVNVFVSRDVVFYSSMLLISGLYLLLLAFAGYVINYFGGAWGSVISIAFLLLGGTVLAALLMTERVRSEVKVFISKHFFANKYDYRLEWLKSIDQLSSSSNENYYKTATEIICSSLNVSQGALVIKVSQGNYTCVYQQDLDIEKRLLHHLLAADKFCQQKGWIIDVREYANVEKSYPELALDVDYCRTQQIDIIIPIFKKKEVSGFFLLSLPNGRSFLNWEDRDLLFAVSKQLSNYMSLNEVNDSLAESKQFEAFHRMSAFLVHDLKNIQAQLGLINANAKRHRDNPEFISDVFETIDSATDKLDKVLTQLRNKQVAESTKKCINVGKLLKQIALQRNVMMPQVILEVSAEIEIVIEQETFYSVLNHIVQNAQEATKDDGWVKIRADIIAESLHIAVLDNGCGMSNDFIKNRLFKPFDTTKGNAGMGIGVYEAKQFIENSSGTMQVTSFEGEGSIFHLTIPCG